MNHPRSEHAAGEIPAWMQRVAELLSVTPDYAFTTDLNGVIQWANSAFIELIGGPIEGQNILIFRPDWVRELVEREARPTAGRDGYWVGRTAILPPGKPERPMRQVLVAHRDSAGQLEGYSGLLRDLTKDEETAERYRVLSETLPVGIFHNDAEGRCLWVNAGYCALLGRPAEALMGFGWMQSLAPKSLELLERVEAAMASEGVFGPYDVDFILPDGTHRTASVRVAPLLLPDGTVTGHIGVVADITARTEQASLEGAEDLFRGVLNAMNEAIVLQDENAAIQLWNPAAERILGLGANELRGVTPTSRDWQAFDVDERPLPGDQYPASVALRTGQSVSGFIMSVQKPDNERVWLRVSSELTTLPGGKSKRGVVTTFVDITAEREAEQQLRRSARQLQTITAAARDAICLHEADGTFAWVSDGSAEVLGWPPDALLGRNPYELFHPDDVERIRRESHAPVLEGSRPRSLTYRFRRADGTYTWVETETAVLPGADASPKRLVTTSHSADVRMASDARNQVRQQLGGVAQFAGRLAHDFTNLYTVARTRLEMARDRISTDVREDIDAAFEAIERATVLTRELRALSGSDPLHTEGADFGSLFAELGQQLSHTVPEHVTVVVQSPPSGVNVLVDRLLLAQVLRAIMDNAVEAMSQGGELVLAAATTRITDVHMDVHGEVSAGVWAQLRVLDKGPGIPVDRLGQLFVPGLTEKGAAVGTGLGLPVALARMRQMGGHISVQNRAEGGAEVILWLPLAIGALVAPIETTPAVPHTTQAGSTDRPVHVLVVDDDAMVLRTAERLIARAGFQVTAVASGYDALAALTASDDRGEPVEIILTDVVMPGLSGPQFVAQLRKEGDTRPVVYMSGYTGDSLPGAVRPEEGATLVSKPFSSAVLLAALRSARASTP